MKRAALARAALTGWTLLAAAGCASTELSSAFEDGRYDLAVKAYEAEPARYDDDRALFMAGVSYAVSPSDTRDTDRAEELLRRLLERYPDTPHGGEARRTLLLLERERAVDAQLADLSRILEELKSVDVGAEPGPAGIDTHEFSRLFREGRYASAIRVFEADPALRESELALFRAGVAYAMPASRAHDPIRARRLFRQLLSRYPDTVYRDAAEWLTALLNREIDLRRTIGELERELEELKAVDLRELPEEGPG